MSDIVKKEAEIILVDNNDLYEFSRDLIINSRKIVYQAANFACRVKGVIAIFSVAKEREAFPLLKTCSYLDHATTGLIPAYSLDAMHDYLSMRAGGIGMAGYWDLWRRADEIREPLGKMFGCEGREIVYGLSSTQLFNIFANGIGLKNGDNVVTPETTYPANAFIWLNKASEGIELRYVDKLANDGRMTPDELFELVDERTRVVSINLVDSRTGFRQDVAEIGRRCRQRGIYMIVDATQAANALFIDVKALNADFVTTSGYKWFLGPLGHGFAYIDKDLLPKLSQSYVGWVGTVDRSRLDARRMDLCDDARRFESGNINFAALFGMEKVVERYLSIGGEAIEDHIMSLVDHVYKRASELSRFKIYGNYLRENRSGIVVFEIPEGIAITDEQMSAHGVRAWVRRGAILRTGFHYMNTMSDVDCLIDMLKKFEKQSGNAQ